MYARRLQKCESQYFRSKLRPENKDPQKHAQLNPVDLFLSYQTMLQLFE